METFSQNEFESLMDDANKSVQGDITWVDDEDHSPTVEFRAEVDSPAGYPLFVRGSYNHIARTATFAVIHRAVGRIYCLDMGKDHHNPTCQHVGEKHKHRWTEQFRDKEAYVPEEITADVGELETLWSQFCAEAKITHHGRLHLPSGLQEDPFQ